MFWQENIESHLYLQAIIFLHYQIILKDTWKAQFFGFMRYICLETLSISIHLKMETEDLLLDFGSCVDTDEMLSISSHFKLFS